MLIATTTMPVPPPFLVYRCHFVKFIEIIVKLRTFFFFFNSGKDVNLPERRSSGKGSYLYWRNWIFELLGTSDVGVVVRA